MHAHGILVYVISRAIVLTAQVSKYKNSRNKNKKQRERERLERGSEGTVGETFLKNSFYFITRKMFLCAKATCIPFKRQFVRQFFFFLFIFI